MHAVAFPRLGSLPSETAAARSACKWFKPIPNRPIDPA